MAIEISSTSVDNGQPGTIPLFNIEDMRSVHSTVKQHSSV